MMSTMSTTDGSVTSEDSDPMVIEENSMELRYEETEKMRRVFSGSLQNLPALSSRIVRIFTSSTFTDTTLERNALMENVYPMLKHYCREKHGLEFQVVDMRWGVRDEATDDHMTTELCMAEIDTCQRLSMGPNFVVFLGQKYGYRPLPTHINAKEFELLRECARNVPSELELLDEWYRKDENAVPAVYVLQPISSILTNYNNKRVQRLQEADQGAWSETHTKLQKIIRKASQVLFITKKIDREHMHRYFMSVTEREVERGILKASHVDEHCLAYIRDITNINTTLLRVTGKFLDYAARNVDGEAQKFLKTLRDEKIPQKLNSENIARFTVEWSGKEGIDKHTHAEYLEQFCEHFHKSVKKSVDNAMAKHERLCNDVTYVEILQHLHACEQFCKVFLGREEVVERVHNYVTSSSCQPLVLYGESGCGKTSLMAKSASHVPTWFPDDISPVLILRFLGTTPGSSSVGPLLSHLCQQLSVVYQLPLEDIPDELAPMILYFKRLLTNATDERPVVLFLDSLDQLSSMYGAHQLAWLPVQLPPHVKLIVSTLPNYYSLLDTLKSVISEDGDYFVDVQPLGENLSSTILNLWLTNANRNISDFQWSIVNEAISKCNLPLYVKLVFDEIAQWKSYTKPEHTTLRYTIHDCIVKLFERIETQHGQTLVSHALGYITASKSGLSEAELDDLLSLDEKVLTDAYQYHIPPVRRVPPLLWTRIRNALPSYLSEREAEGVNVIGWYHRQFIDAAKERYFKNLNFVSDIHSHIADYFLGTWGGGIPKPFEYSEQQRQRFYLDEKQGESDRKVPIQPVLFTDSDGKLIRYNLRKLGELPYHLVRSHRYDDLFSNVLFNYKWLHAKLSSMPMQSLLSDFEDLLSYLYDKDVKLLEDAIRLSSSVLSHYPNMLAPQIAGRLLPHYATNPKIQDLIDQCDTEGIHHCALIPAHHCLHTPGGPLQYSLEGHPFAPFGVVVTSDGKYLVSVSNKFIIWDLSSGDVVRIVTPGIEGIMQALVLTPDDKHAVSYTNNNQVLICAIMTGEFYVISNPVNMKYGPITGITAKNTSNFTIWTESEWCEYVIQDRSVERHHVGHDQAPLIQIQYCQNEIAYLVLKSGFENDRDLALEAHDGSFDPFEFHSAIVLTRDLRTAYACIEISDYAIVSYKLSGSVWRYNNTLMDNKDPVFALTLSQDEHILIATQALGFQLYDLRKDATRQLKLPHGTRNIPSKNQISSLVLFTKSNHFVVGAVRKNLYVWDMAQGNLVTTLDAHFGRIVALTAVYGSVNIVISSSIDKTIKIWNFHNILEDVHSIDRHEKPIETLHLSSETYNGVTTTRNCIGVWNLENGKLLKLLNTTSIVSNAVISNDGRYVIATEAQHIAIWDVANEKVMNAQPQKDIQQLLLSEDDTRVIAVSKDGINKGVCVCRTVPEGNEVYTFEYSFKKFRKATVNCDGLFLIVPVLEKSHDALSVYHAKTGIHQHIIPLKFTGYKDFTNLLAMPRDPNQVALIETDKGHIIDLKKKCLHKSLHRWSGMCTQNGKIGLYAPARGGLELIELKHGKTVRTLIPKVAEGVFSIKILFTRNDRHAVYYHSGHRTIEVFRVADGKRIANYKAHAEVKVMEGTPGGSSLVVGCVDGSLTVLTIADPLSEASREFLQSLPSRQPFQSHSPSHVAKGAANGNALPISDGKNSMGTTLQVARFVAKAHCVQKSRACAVS